MIIPNAMWYHIDFLRSELVIRLKISSLELQSRIVRQFDYSVILEIVDFCISASSRMEWMESNGMECK